MEFIITNTDYEDLGLIHEKSYLDIDIGGTNDFVLKERLEHYDPELYSPGFVLYSLGTEYGGILNDPEISTSNGTISFTGDTFRGMLAKKIIEPPEKLAYYTISGDLNECIDELVKVHYDTLFKATGELAGVTIASWQIDRYCTLLDGIEKMLASVGYRLNIKAEYVNHELAVVLSAEPIIDHSDEVETSQDSDVNFVIKQYTNRYNYMICLGSGELEAREVAYLHLLDDGTAEEITEIPAGIGVNIYVYDYTNAESREILISDGIKKFTEINSTDTQKMTIKDDLQLELGDIVGGRDYITGMVIKQAITQKIVKLQNRKLTISYKVGDGI